MPTAIANELDQSLTAIEQRKQKELDTRRAEITKANDAQRKRLYASVTAGKTDKAMVAFYEPSEHPRRDLEADLSSCRNAIEREQLVAQAAQAQAEYEAASERIRDLEPLIQQAKRDLDATRRQQPNRPNEDDLRALRTAERTLEDLTDSEFVARNTIQDQSARVRSLRARVDELGVRFDPQSELASPLNFVLTTSTDAEEPPTFGKEDRLSHFHEKRSKANDELARLDAEIQAQQSEFELRKAAYEQSRASEDSPLGSEIKAKVQTAEDKLTRLKDERKRTVKFIQNMTERIAQLAR